MTQRLAELVAPESDAAGTAEEIARLPARVRPRTEPVDLDF